MRIFNFMPIIIISHFVGRPSQGLNAHASLVKVIGVN